MQNLILNLIQTLKTSIYKTKHIPKTPTYIFKIHICSKIRIFQKLDIPEEKTLHYDSMVLSFL